MHRILDSNYNPQDLVETRTCVAGRQALQEPNVSGGAEIDLASATHVSTWG